MCSLRPTPTVFDEEAVGRRVRQPVNFGAHGDRGCTPQGMKALLDSCGLNSESLWLKSAALFPMGVIVPRTNISIAAIEERIATMSHLYPVVNQTKHMGVAVHENVSLRGYHIIGDEMDIAKFWAGLVSHDVMVRGMDCVPKAMCWTAMVPGKVYVPYLDFDELGNSPLDLSEVLSKRVAPCIALINDAIVKQQEKALYVIFFNSRPLESGLTKFSFHVHWFNCGIQNINSWKLFLSSLTEAPRKLSWKKTAEGKWEVHPDETKPMMDLAVYSGTRQLFRGPYCGKEGNACSAMKPIKIVKEGETWKTQELQDYTTYTYILMARISVYPGARILMIGFKDQGTGAPVPMIRQPAPGAHTVKTSKMAVFVRPLLIAEILPKWQSYRKCILMGTEGVRGAVVPVDNIQIIKDEACTHKTGVWFMAIQGDTFCMKDEQHVHSQNPRCIGLLIDFNKCTISQTCYACKGKFEEFNFLHTNNRIDIKSDSDSRFTAVSHWGPDPNVHQCLLSYFAASFRLHRQSQAVYVYDESRRIWKTGVEGNMVVGQLVDKVNVDYNTYIQTYKQGVVDRQIAAYSRANPDATQEEAEVAVEKIYTEARKFVQKNNLLIKISPEVRSKLMSQLQSFKVTFELEHLNPIEHYIPMKNGLYFDVFTGETGEIKKDHYFTSVVNAERTQSKEDLEYIKAWFDEISTGNAEKALTVKLLAGYMFTMLIHDRKFYVIKGSGKNAKGVYKQFILDILEGPHNSDARYKVLNSSFWEKRANQNTGAEAPTPEAFSLQNRSVLYTDDVERVVIDAGKLKKMVAGEVGSGRTLHGTPVVIKIRGKVLWTTNHTLDLNGSDNALWERFFALEFLTKYVENLADVDEKAYRFLCNSVKVEHLLTKLDAFFTICTTALHEYYRKLPFDEARKAPSALQHFPVPVESAKLHSAMRAQQLPLASFMAQHTKVTNNPLDYVPTDKLFQNYITFLENVNEKSLRNSTTLTVFIRLLGSALDIGCGPKFVTGRALTVPVTSTNQKSYGSHEAAQYEHKNEHPEGYYLDRAIQSSASAGH